MGAMSEGGSARCRVLQGGVTGSHGFTSHFIACYKITGGHTPWISHQTSRSHAISFKADQRCSQLSGIGAQVSCKPGEFYGKDCVHSF